MDFYRVSRKRIKEDNIFKIAVYPEFIVDQSKDMMVRGKDFYAVWDEKLGLWNTNRMAVRKLIDKDIQEEVNNVKKEEKEKHANDDSYNPKPVVGQYLRDFSTNHWVKFDKFVQSIKDNYKQLDTKITFQDTVVKKEDYVSRRLPYSVQEGACPAWEEIISTLYDPEEREKIEWAIGSILSGDSRTIQKFLVFYGPQGTGKGTMLDIIMKLFDGYYTTFKAANLVQGNDQFNLDFMACNPLVVIDADTNLAKIESNATLNKLVSHEQLQVNEKFKGRYPIKPLCMLMLGTNKPVRITDAKSGLIRRLIDVEPSGRLILPETHYDELMSQVGFELGAIAYQCMQVYKELGKSYYNSYIPERMMYRTDAFFNFMEEKAEVFIKNDGVSGNDLWAMWKDYCQQSGIEFTRKRFEIIDEAKNYFAEFTPSTTRNGNSVRSWLSGLKLEKFNHETQKERYERSKLEREKLSAEEKISKDNTGEYSYGWLNLNHVVSLFDKEFADYPAQYECSEKAHRPKNKWEKSKTKLKDLDTSQTHWFKGPSQLIFVDFDKHGPDGEKSLKLNLEAAGSSIWKPTYAELSNSGKGIHSYYWYDGNIDDLSSIFDHEIEIKKFPEGQYGSIRRRLTRCNNLPIAHISSGLPLKKDNRKMINWEGVKDEQHLRNLICNAVAKKVRPYGEEPKTITCVKYISDVLKDAQEANMAYDIRDLDNVIYSFAANSSHNSKDCLDIYYKMELIWPPIKGIPVDSIQAVGNILDGKYAKDAPIIILDCEVVKNLTLVVYKELGPEKKCIRLYNPKPHDVEKLFSMRIVGHNVTGYDNFILYAIWLGYTPEQVFQVSQDIIKNGNRLPWREARNVSYTDTYDVSSDKKGLKKIEIEMHFPHKEMEIDWDKPLPESEWERLAEYCENDVRATEAYFLSKKWQSDFKARKILAALTGMTVNDSTNNLTAQLIFGDVREPWHEFNYPDLKEEFPEYRFENGKSYYGDVLIGEGGRVYAEEGTYYHVITFDVAGMHPISVIVKKGFGPYTQPYDDLYEARIAIKHKDYDAARKMFNGRLAPYLTTDEDADALSQALKIALNSVYGMTAAHFQNRFKDPRNGDNWVAKRGALFMEKLRREVQARGGHVIHIKTDSIKLVQPTQELQDFVIAFGKKYGYTFEVESKYERICLVNHAVYIALREKDDPGWLKECKKAKEDAEKNGIPYIEPTRWTATGAQFAHPYVFKHLFSHERMNFWDFCETKTVKTALYLDMNEALPDVSQEEKELKKIETKIKKLQKGLETSRYPEADLMEIDELQEKIKELKDVIKKGHSYHFVGKAGEFMPIKAGYGGGELVRIDDSGGFSSATGAKGYRWLESENLVNIQDWQKYIDIRYFRGLVDVAIETIGQYCDFDLFVNGEDDIILPEDKVIDYDFDPWQHPCKNDKYAYCSDCPDFENDEPGSYYCKKGFDISNQILGESKEN